MPNLPKTVQPSIKTSKRVVESKLRFFVPDGKKILTQPLDLIWFQRALGKTGPKAFGFCSTNKLANNIFLLWQPILTQPTIFPI